MSGLSLLQAAALTLLGIVLLCWLAYLATQPLPPEDRPEDYAADDDFDPTGGMR